MKLTLNSVAAFSLAAFIMFSSVSPVVASSHKNEAHINAPGQIKKAAKLFTGNQTNKVPELPTQASQVAVEKLVEVEHKQNPGNNSVSVKVNANHKQVVVNNTTNSNRNNDHVDMHCTNHNANTVVKAESSKTITVSGQSIKVVISGPTVSFYDINNAPISVDFCLKASTKNSGTLTGSTGTVSFKNNGGQTPDISYVAVYRINKNSTPTPTPTITPTTTPEDDGETLSTNTKKTGVLGSNVSRTAESLPSTGGVGMALAQAFGLFLIVVGAVVAHVRRIQAKIEAQMSV